MPERRTETGSWTIDPVFRMRHRFTQAGDALRVESVVDPGGGVTPHVHPAMEERFEVLEGRCEFLAGYRWTAADAGEVVTVPAGTRHAFRNRGAAPTRIVCTATPGSSLQAFLEDTAGLSRAGKLLRIGLPAPSGLLEAAALIDGYEDMVHFRFPVPPRPIRRPLMWPLARLARRRGLRAGTFKDLG